MQPQLNHKQLEYIGQLIERLNMVRKPKNTIEVRERAALWFQLLNYIIRLIEADKMEHVG